MSPFLRPKLCLMWSRYTLLLVVLLLIVLMVAWDCRREADRAQVFEEKAGYLELAGLAARMIRDREEGVVILSDSRSPLGYIMSFDHFFDYVKKHRPEVVSTRDADNPFPGLLPSKKYARAPVPTSQPSDRLFWSVETWDRNSTSVEYRLYCDGYYQSNDTDIRKGVVPKD